MTVGMSWVLSSKSLPLSASYFLMLLLRSVRSFWSLALREGMSCFPLEFPRVSSVHKALECHQDVRRRTCPHLCKGPSAHLPWGFAPCLLGTLPQSSRYTLLHPGFLLCTAGLVLSASHLYFLFFICLFVQFSDKPAQLHLKNVQLKLPFDSGHFYTPRARSLSELLEGTCSHGATEKPFSLVRFKMPLLGSLLLWRPIPPVGTLYMLLCSLHI